MSFIWGNKSRTRNASNRSTIERQQEEAKRNLITQKAKGHSKVGNLFRAYNKNFKGQIGNVGAARNARLDKEYQDKLKKIEDDFKNEWSQIKKDANINENDLEHAIKETSTTDYKKGLQWLSVNLKEAIGKNTVTKAKVITLTVPVVMAQLLMRVVYLALLVGEMFLFFFNPLALTIWSYLFISQTDISSMITSIINGVLAPTGALAANFGFQTSRGFFKDTLAKYKSKSTA